MYRKAINRLSVETYGESKEIMSCYIKHQKNESVFQEIELLKYPEIVDLHYMLGQIIDAAKDQN